MELYYMPQLLAFALLCPDEGVLFLFRLYHLFASCYPECYYELREGPKALHAVIVSVALVVLYYLLLFHYSKCHKA
jgi:hypothetical protein